MKLNKKAATQLIIGLIIASFVVWFVLNFEDIKAGYKAGSEGSGYNYNPVDKEPK